MLDYALQYAAKGWPVLPLHRMVGDECSCGKSDCSSPGKHPVGHLVPNGLANATRDERQIVSWWQNRPWNIGIATGSSSGVVVVDVDDHAGGMDSLRELEARYGKLTHTLHAYTGGGGLHLFFAHPGHPVANSAGKIATGIDVRGDGGYVVAAPSNHQSGDAYEWKDTDSPILPMPGFVCPPPSDLLVKSQQPTALEGKIPQGNRNNTFVSIAGSMRRRGLPANVIMAGLSEMNRTMTEVPLTTSELEKIVESVCRYAPEDVITGIDDVIQEYDETSASLLATPMSDLMVRVHADIAQRVQDGGGLIGLSWGFRRLDEMTGGAAKGDMIVIGARPSMGKTALAVTMARTMGYHDQVAIFSAEMSEMALGYRFVSMDSGIEGMKLRRGDLNDEELSRVTKSAGRISPLKIWVADDSSITPNGIRRTLMALKREHGYTGAVFADYLQLLRTDQRFKNREEAVAEISRELKAIAKEFVVPVIPLAQLNRNVEGRRDKRPGLADLRESGQIEQDADAVFFIHRPEYYGDAIITMDGIQRSSEGVAEVIIAKQRNGPVGEVYLGFDANTATFSNYSPPLSTGREPARHFTA